MQNTTLGSIKAGLVAWLVSAEGALWFDGGVAWCNESGQELWW